MSGTKTAFSKQSSICLSGNVMVGLNGIVIKSHGGADNYAFGKAILEARKEVQQNIPALISKQLEQLLTKREAV